MDSRAECNFVAHTDSAFNIISIHHTLSLFQVYFYYFHVSNVIVSANSSVNFVVYCVFRRQFRHRLRDCCRGQRERRVTICQSSLYGPRRGIVVTTRNTAHGINDVMHYPLRVVVPTVNWGSVSDRETTPTAGSRNV